MEATLLQEVFQVGGHGIDTLGFTNIGDTPTKTAQSKPQSSTDVVSTFHTLTSPLPVRQFTFKPALTSYALVS